MTSKKYLQVVISAENKRQADDILNALLRKKLVTGGLILSAPARFLWKGKIIDMDYYNLTSFTLEKHQQAIIDEVKNVSIEEVPMISFTHFEGNKELFRWIDKTVG